MEEAKNWKNLPPAFLDYDQAGSFWSFFLPLKASRREFNRVRTSERLFFIISLTPLPSFDGLQPTRPTHSFRWYHRHHRACSSIAVYVRRPAVRHCLFNGSRSSPPAIQRYIDSQMSHSGTKAFFVLPFPSFPLTVMRHVPVRRHARPSVTRCIRMCLCNGSKIGVCPQIPTHTFYTSGFQSFFPLYDLF